MVSQYQKHRAVGSNTQSTTADKLQLLEQTVSQLIVQVQRQEQELRRLNSKLRTIKFS